MSYNVAYTCATFYTTSIINTCAHHNIRIMERQSSFFLIKAIAKYKAIVPNFILSRINELIQVFFTVAIERQWYRFTMHAFVE